MLQTLCTLLLIALPVSMGRATSVTTAFASAYSSNSFSASDAFDGLASAKPSVSSLSASAISTSTLKPQYRLRLFHTHTNEHLDIVYRQGDSYVPEAIDELEFFLRDHRTGTVHHFDPRLFDLLNDLTAKVGRPQEEIDVVCGYRTPWSNNFLRNRSSAVAKHSLHMQAMAIDIRMPGIQTAQLRDAALSLHRGGVGYYARQQFVHVDVGRVRRW